MFDSHCHLTNPQLSGQLHDVLRRSIEAGVTRIVTIGTDPDDHQSCIELCENHASLSLYAGRGQGRGFFESQANESRNPPLPNPLPEYWEREVAIRCALGIHPHNADGLSPTYLDDLRKVLSHRGVVALGEIGMDYHYPTPDRAVQKKVFEQQLQLAVELNLPVVIHCRDAVEDGLNMLKRFPQIKAVFHCFTGSFEEGMKIIEQGYLIGFTGAVTFKKSDELRQLAAEMPIDRMLIETDAPYLSPEPMRKQKINEPALLCYTAACIGACRKMEIEAIDRITTENANRFYRWE